MEGVISVFRSKTLQLHTTRSWDFLGLTLDSKVTPWQLAFGDDIVVGVFDTGFPISNSSCSIFGRKGLKAKLIANPNKFHWQFTTWDFSNCKF